MSVEFLELRVPVLIFIQVEVPVFLPSYRRNSVRSSQISGSGEPFQVGGNKYETGLASALFTEDNLPAC